MPAAQHPTASSAPGDDLHADLDRAAGRKVSLRAVVEHHLGTSNAAVVKAVARLWAAQPAPLERAAFDMVVAAAPLLDPNHVATLIGDIPVTGLRAAVTPVDIAATRDKLVAIFSDADGRGPAYRTTTRAKLVRSLVHDNVQQLLSLVPPEHLSVGAVDALAAPLANEVRSPKPLHTIDIPPHLMTPPLARQYLERATAELVRAGGGTSAHPVVQRHWRRATEVLGEDAAFVLQAGRTCSEVHRLIAESPSTTPMLAALPHQPAWLQRAITSNPAAPPDRLRGYARPALEEPYAKSSMLTSLAANPATPPDVLSAIHEVEAPSFDRWLAVNSAIPPEVLASIANGHDRAALTAVLRLPSPPWDIVRPRFPRLDEDHQVLVAGHPAIDGPALREVMGSGCRRARATGAANPAAPPELLLELARTLPANDSALQALARNPAASSEVLSTLLERAPQSTTSACASHPNLADEDFDAIWAVAHLRDDLLRNPSLPERFVRAAAANQWTPSTRMLAAQHPNLPPDAALTLARDPDRAVRSSLAANPSAGTEVLATVLTEPDPDVEIQKRVLGNPGCTPELAAQVAARGDLDPHDLVRAACTPRFACGVRVDLPSVAALDVTVEARRATPLPPDSGLRAWSDLPNDDDLPFDFPNEARRIEATKIADLRARLPRTPRQLRALGDRMGNCVGLYVDAVRTGKTLIAAYEDPERDEVYAAAWDRRSDGTWMLRELNSKGNHWNVPPEVERAIQALTNDLSRRAATISRLGKLTRRRTNHQPVRDAPAAAVGGDPDRGGDGQPPAIDRADGGTRRPRRAAADRHLPGPAG